MKNSDLEKYGAERKILNGYSVLVQDRRQLSFSASTKIGDKHITGYGKTAKQAEKDLLFRVDEYTRIKKGDKV